jgi:hypothetical protein
LDLVATSLQKDEFGAKPHVQLMSRQGHMGTSLEMEVLCHLMNRAGILWQDSSAVPACV